MKNKHREHVYTYLEYEISKHDTVNTCNRKKIFSIPIWRGSLKQKGGALKRSITVLVIGL